ncbi:MAG: hypothetical protein HC890_10070 [Chloroflexaceae bacterium]|nr:hypothetical protein [Chloroflexaceae bacterium]
MALAGCSERSQSNRSAQEAIAPRGPKLTEVAPPSVLSELTTELASHQPQLSILSPEPEAIIAATEVEVKLQVQDLPLFENEELHLGPCFRADFR